MALGRPSPHGLLLEDRFVQDDSGVAIGRQRIRPYAKHNEVFSDISVDEVQVVGRSRSPDVDDATNRKTVSFPQS